MDTPIRLLRLLTMFTTRASWSADELAERLEVTTRTLRRDVARLRELGYPISSTTGRYGGYELGAGGRLPSLLRDRVDALGEVVVGIGRAPAPREGAPIELPTLMGLAMCSRRGERVTFTCRSGSDAVTERRVEPHRLVSLGRRWYLVGFDLDRDDWRTYRVDRVTHLVATGHRSTPRETPDAAAQVSEGVALRVFDTHARVRVYAPLAEAMHHIGPTVRVFEPQTGDGDGTSMVVIGGDPDWI